MGRVMRPEALNRSQDLGEFYRLNGAIHIFDARELLEQKIRYTAKSYVYVMDNRVSFDIDQMLDFEFAEFFMKKTP